MLRLGNGAEAERPYRESLAIPERLAEADPGSAEAQRDLSYVYTALGDVMRDAGQAPVAERFYRDALAVERRLGEADPTSVTAQQDLAVTYQRLGDLLASLDKRDEAASVYREHLAWIEDRLGPGDQSAESVRAKLHALEDENA